MNNKASKKPFYFIMLTLLMIFALPMVLAWCFYRYEPHLKTNNYGQLIQPSLSFSQLTFQIAPEERSSKFSSQRKWILLYVSPIPYDPLCEDNLYKMHQVRIATGKEMQRIVCTVLTFGHQSTDNHLNQLLTTQYIDTFHLITEEETFKNFIKSLPHSEQILQQGYLFLIDPLGNVIMGYSPDVDMASVYKDLIHLLNSSQIG